MIKLTLLFLITISVCLSENYELPSFLDNSHETISKTGYNSLRRVLYQKINDTTEKYICIIDSLSFNKNGTTISYTKFVNDSLIKFNRIYQLNSEDSVIAEITFDKDGSPDLIKNYIYVVENAQLIEKKVLDNESFEISRYIFKYSGTLLRSIIHYDATGSISLIDSIEYNISGKIKAIETRTNYYAPVKSFSFQYDSAGRITSLYEINSSNSISKTLLVNYFPKNSLITFSENITDKSAKFYRIQLNEKNLIENLAETDESGKELFIVKYTYLKEE